MLQSSLFFFIRVTQTIFSIIIVIVLLFNQGPAISNGCALEKGCLDVEKIFVLFNIF